MLSAHVQLLGLYHVLKVGQVYPKCKQLTA